ncbi:MAG TPA: TonB-dependent receptor, partial [Opitutus sp.]|nr:TonB-dependent receptor [Opitutus sp.]
SLDYNYVLIPQELAFRIDLLSNHEKFQQTPAFQRDERVFGALRYEPKFLAKGSAKTILRANYEAGRIDANRPRVIPPGDSITQWWLTGTTKGYTATGQERQCNNLHKMGFHHLGLQSGDVAALGDPTRGAQAGNLPNGTPNPNQQPWLGGQLAANHFGNPIAIFDGTGQSAPRLLSPNPNSPRGINSAGAIDGNINGFPPGSTMSSITTYRDWTRKTQQPGAFYGFTKNLILTDPSIFDFYNNLIDGPNKKEWQSFNRFNVNLAQTFFDGDVGFEFAYDQQKYRNGQLTILADRAYTLYIDVIKYLADGSLNPNFGRPFVGDTLANNVANVSERDSKRATAYVRHDFSEKNPDSLLGRILGTQTLTGFFNEDTRKLDARNFVRYSADLAYKDLIAGTNATSNFNDNNRVIFPVFYLGPSLEPRSAVQGANIPRIAAELTVPAGTSIRTFDSTWAPAAGVNPGDPWVNTYWPEGNTRRNSTQSENPANYRGWVNAPFNFIDSEKGNRDALTRFARLDKTTVQSKALVYNGSFYDGALVGMYGYREDRAKAFTYTGVRLPSGGPINLDPSVYRLPSTPRDNQKLTSKTWSVVAHLTEFFPNNPLPFEISVFYNKSENFSVAPGRVGLYGENLGPPKGNTTD